VKKKASLFKTLQWAVVDILLFLFIFSAVFTNRTLRSIEQTLPAILLEQLQDLSFLVEGLADFSLSIEQALQMTEEDTIKALLDQANAIGHIVVDLRETFVYDNLVHASAIHAIVAPAIMDAKIWLTEGISGFSPDTPTTLQILRTRIHTALIKARQLNRESHQTAQSILENQRKDLDQYLIYANLLFVLNLMVALSMGFLLYQQYRIQQKENRADQLRLEAEKALLRRNEFEHILMEVSRSMIELSNGDFDSSIKTVLGQVGAFLQVDRSLMIQMDLDEKHRHKVLVWERAAKKGMDDSTVIPDLVGLSKFMERMHDFQYLRVRSIEKWDDEWVEERSFFQKRGVQSLIYLPVEHHNVLIGVLGFEVEGESREWDLDELSLLQILSDIFANAAQKEKIARRLEYEATHDFLTGIPNRRATLLALAKELERARRFGSGLMVGMLDLDHFKRINDSFGHQAGDHVLYRLVDVVTNDLRSYDMMGRVGGEEFLIIVPFQTGETDCRSLFKRICNKIAQTSFSTDGNQVHITASIGVYVGYGQSTVDQVLLKSDRALYQAKEEGRNRVVFSDE